MRRAVSVYVDRQLEDSKATLKHSPNKCVPVAAAVLHVAGDFMRDFSTKLVPLLEDDVRVMIYAGRLLVDKQLRVCLRQSACNWVREPCMDVMCQNIHTGQVYEACCVSWRGTTPRRRWRRDSHHLHAQGDLLC